MKAKTLYRLVDNIMPRLGFAVLVIVTIVCAINICYSVIKGDFKSAASFALVTFLFGTVTTIIHNIIWKEQN